MLIRANRYIPRQEFKTIKTQGKKADVLERWISLDTETSHNHNTEKDLVVGWIYQWAFKFGNDRVIGRKPSELMKALRVIKEKYGIGNDKHIVVYVHNLSYDIQYLKDFLIEEFGNEYKVLALNPHHFISFYIAGFEFRCTYVLSNKSLDKWSTDLGCINRKKIGLVDYDKIHFQTEILTDADWEYMIGDIDTLDECVEKQMALYGDNIYHIPLTSTGYIRRECRRRFKEDYKKNHDQFIKTRLNITTYDMAEKAFAGGLTHGNRFYTEKTLTIDKIRSFYGKDATIQHRDFVSHYPSQQRTETFPIGVFHLYKRNASVDDVERLVKSYCLLMEITIDCAKLKSKAITFPLMQVSKCKEGKIGRIDMIEDNGRVLQLKGKTKLYVTDLDLKWLRKQYDFGELVINELWRSTRGYLPKFLIETVDYFMQGKTMYKELEKKETDPAKKLDYALSLMKAKNGLNGIYGMSATKLIRNILDMEINGDWINQIPSGNDRVEELNKYYKSRNSFMSYQFGVWTTANARNELMEFIELVGYDKAIYCDTDSLFYISTTEVERKIEAKNDELRERSEKLKAYIMYNGKKVYFNQFDNENEEIISFRFLHAKCYCYEKITKNKDGSFDTETKLTIAGVASRVLDGFDENNKPIWFTREMELQKIDNLQPDFTFYRCGGTRCLYVEHETDTFINTNGEETEYAGSAIIMNVTKTLSNELDSNLSLFELEVV